MTQYSANINNQLQTGVLTWGPEGLLGTLKITDAFNGSDNQTCTYGHDDLSRIGTVNCNGTPAVIQTFTYDPFGNLMKSGTFSFQPSYSPSNTNQYTTVGGCTASWDADGHALNDCNHTYSWDVYGRAVTIDGVGATYDALDRMVEQNRSGAYTQLVYSTTGFKMQYMSGQTVQAWLVPSAGRSLAEYYPNGSIIYRHPDWLGSSRLDSTPSRTVSGTVAYAPFGEQYDQSTGALLLFTGQGQDTVTNLYDFPAREYNLLAGRWPSPDPAGIAAVNPADPQTWNRYAYVRNNPLALNDPSGLGAVQFQRLFYSNTDLAGDCTVDGLSTPCGTAAQMLAGGAAWNPSAIAIYLWGGVPFLTDNLNGILTDPTNPPLAFVNNEVYLDPFSDDTLVGAYVDLPTLDSPWAASFLYPVVPITIPVGEVPIPIGDIGIAGSFTLVPQSNQICASAGAGVQFPFQGRSWSVGPLMTGSVENTTSVETGPSNNYNVNLPWFVPLGWQYTTNSSGTVGGATIGSPGASYSWTVGKCAPIK